MCLAELAEEFVDKLALAKCLVNFQTLFEAECADLLLALAVAVETCLLLDCVEDRQTAVRCLERYDVVAHLALCRAVYGDADSLEQFLCERHHPVVVLILHVELHTCELRVVVAVHTLVAEVLTNLVNALETAHDKTL